MMPKWRRAGSRGGTARRGRMWLLAALAALPITTAAVVAVAYPSLAATTCPGCYGLERLTEGVYAEPGLPPYRKRQVISAVEEAERRVRDFYGGRRASPRILACLSDRCYRRIGGGGERGVAVLNRAVMLSPSGVDPVIASHEMSHVELHVRLDSGAQVPQWFNEGLAVLVSGDPRYLAPDPASGTAAGAPADRCLMSTDAPLPVTLDAWLRAAGADRNTYAQAACRVSRWVTANGGPHVVLDLVRRLNEGETFGAVTGM
ncbi:hypothetical protein F5972_05355 [Microbispora cellulosiformans]|uniref:Uncharacterized protein n=1 Tax=Microbispora cellulosiformans TaxID=2614688 RepID=A0A5J5KAI0_9ACTN|nr:hypothetical protein [Microbispora cellulosiformans]KAA9380562.1 hypothetical protein F5972_05355 [Microbispora cellulosiformans]